MNDISVFGDLVCQYREVVTPYGQRFVLKNQCLEIALQLPFLCVSSLVTLTTEDHENDPVEGKRSPT